VSLSSPCLSNTHMFHVPYPDTSFLPQQHTLPSYTHHFPGTRSVWDAIGPIVSNTSDVHLNTSMLSRSESEDEVHIYSTVSHASKYNIYLIKDSFTSPLTFSTCSTTKHMPRFGKGPVVLVVGLEYINDIGLMQVMRAPCTTVTTVHTIRRDDDYVYCLSVVYDDVVHTHASSDL